MAEWKKVLLKGANVTTEQLVATDAEIAVAADSIVFADEGSSGHLKKERVTDFATKLAGTNTATGLKAASGVIGLDKDTTAIGTIATGDILLAYDIDANVWGTVTANEVGSAGGNTDSQYSVEAIDTSDTSATIKLVGAGTAAGTDDTVVVSAGGELTIDTNEGSDTISLGTNTAITSFVSVYNNNLLVGRNSSNQIDFSTDNKITFKTNNADNDSVQLNGTAFQPVNDGVLELGLTGRRWKEGWFDKLEVDNIRLDSTTIQHQDGSTPLTFKGTADDATKVDTTNVSNDAAHHLLFVNADDSTNQGAETATALTYNPGTSTLVCTNITGTASNATAAVSATTATTANKVKINDADTTDDTFYFLFSDSHGGTSQDVYADNSFTWNPNSETLSVTNLKVAGTSTTVNTTDLAIKDKTIIIAEGSAAVGDADGSGIMIDAGDTSTNPSHMPELKWNNGGKLAGWTISNYDAAGATDFPVAIMTDGSGAPGGTAAGSGSFYVDTDSGALDLYVYI